MKARVIRGVYIRGKAYPEDAIVELSPIEFAELKNTNYVVAATESAAPAAESKKDAQANEEQLTLEQQGKETTGGRRGRA